VYEGKEEHVQFHQLTIKKFCLGSIKHRRVAEEYRDFKSSVGCIFQRDFRGSRGRYFIVSKRVRLVYIIFTILRIIIGIMFFNRNHPFLFLSIFYSDRQNKYICLSKDISSIFTRKHTCIIVC
jgi:hypothetical protein